MENAVAGLDLGTSSLKIILCDFEKKVIYSDKVPFPGGVSDGKTINPHALLAGVAELLSKAVRKNRDIKIKAIGMSSIFPSLLALDCQGEPLTEIFSWGDNRAHQIVEEFKKDKEKAGEVHRKTGCVVHESHSLWKVLWLKNHNKKVFSKAARFVSASEYLTHKLTGKFAVSKSIASTTGFYNLHLGEWDSSILGMVGIDKDNLSPLYNTYHSERILDEFCVRAGLDPGSVLVLGGGDGLLCHIGSGCLGEGIMSSTVGTSAALRVVSDKPRAGNPRLWCYYLDDGKYVFGSAINAGGKSLQWFKENLVCRQLKYLDKAAAGLPIEGPIFLPFLDGGRGPDYKPNRTASFVGLTSRDGGYSMYRSMLEGIFFNLYSCYEVLVEEAGHPSELRASGGYTNSDVMLQMQSDVFNQEVLVPDVEHASALGAAMVALKSLGEMADLAEFEIGIRKRFCPDQKRHKKYLGRYRSYKRLCGLLS